MSKSFSIITSWDFSKDARRIIEQQVSGKRDIILINDQMLIGYLRKYSNLILRISLSFTERIKRRNMKLKKTEIAFSERGKTMSQLNKQIISHIAKEYDGKVV